MYKHVMLDLETLGTTADAVIMSIGAVRFDLDGDSLDDEAFYASVSIDSNLEQGRRVDENTLIWWLGQPAAQTVFHEPKQSLEAALDALTAWFGEDADQLHTWSNGADFDLPMLAHAYRSFGWDAPWKFWNNRCFRTFKNLPGAHKTPRIEQGMKHNALDDAIYQARKAQAIQRLLAEQARA